MPKHKKRKRDSQGRIHRSSSSSSSSTSNAGAANSCSSQSNSKARSYTPLITDTHANSDTNNSAGIELIKDPKIKDECNAFVDLGRKSTYSLEKVINAPGKKLKKAIVKAMQQYETVLVDSIKMFTKVDLKNDDLQVIINAAREPYDLALFNFYFMNIELKYQNESNKVIGDEITSKLDHIYSTLNNITANDRKISKELLINIHYLSRLADILTLRLERLAYAYKWDEKSSQIIHDVVLKISNCVRELRKSGRDNNSTEKLAKSFVDFFQSYSVALKNLTEVGKSAGNHQPDVSKSILIETLAIATTFSTKLDFFIKTK